MKIKLNMIYVIIAATNIVLLSYADSALAQYNYYTSASFYHNTNTYPIIKFNQYTNNQYVDNDEKAKSHAATKQRLDAKPAARPSKPSASANNNPLPYSRDRALSAKIREDFLADFAKQMPDVAADMRVTTERTDLVQVVAGLAQLQGLDSSAMENLMAFWYGQAWAIVHQKPLPTPQQYQGIAQQLRLSVVKSTEWRNMSNEKRQMLFEQLAYPLFVQKANYEAYLRQGKREHIARMASGTQEGLKKIGLDLQNLRLSDNGFIGL